FQAEDGIRDRTVTGVQTCALPIYGLVTIASGDRSWYDDGWRSGDSIPRNRREQFSVAVIQTISQQGAYAMKHHLARRGAAVIYRSEERRVGKEGRLHLVTEA